MDFKRLYEENERFRKFVDKSCKTYCKTVDETLSELIVQEIGLEYAKDGCKERPIEVKMKAGCNGAC